MTFKEWLQQKRDYLTAFYGRANESYLTSNEIDLAEEAWDAAMGEAARRILDRSSFYRSHGGDIAESCAAALHLMAQELTSGATPAPPEEAPGREG